MVKYLKLSVVLVVFMSWYSCVEKQVDDNGFVKVENGRFIIDGSEYLYAGANYWQGMHLGSTQYGDREQLKRELDQLKSYGINNLRIMASCEADSNSLFCMQPALQTKPGVYDSNLWEGLDFLLAEMQKRDMKAVVVLSNFWSWSGGFSQYLKWAGHGEIPYPQLEEYGWWDYGEYTKAFFSNTKALEWYKNHVVEVLSRKNSVNGKYYKDDATIMAWQLANEPRGYSDVKVFSEWIQKTTALIKTLDNNHLVSLGSEGNTPSPKEGLNALVDNAYDDIDYITMHIWVQNWNWYTPGEGDDAYNDMINKFDSYWDDHVKVSKELGKPLVLEEYGLARDNFSYEVKATMKERNTYYNYAYNKFVSHVKEKGAVKGVNFWSYSGESRPPRPGDYWQLGDEFIGDPPHELQGWYGVYDTDVSTLKIIQDNMNKIK